MRASWPAALTSRLVSGRSVVVPAVVGVCALVLAVVFAYIMFRGSAPSAKPGPDAAVTVDTDRFVSRKGGFSLDLPEDLKASRKGRTAQFVTKDQDLVIVVGPGEEGSLRQANEQFLSTLKAEYKSLTLTGTQSEEIDGRRALTTYGQATNTSKIKLRFVSVVVRAQPRNYTIVAYTAFDSDPSVVLPRLHAVVNSFKVLPGRKN